MSISFEIKADKAIKRFNATLKRAQNPKTIMDILAVESWKNVIDHFSDEEGRKRQWVKWSRRMPNGHRKFFNSRPTKRGGTKLLQDTGTLRSSIRFRSIKNEAHVYTKQSYAKYHQFGTVKMVKRDFMWLSRSTRKKLSKMFIYYISRGVK